MSLHVKCFISIIMLYLWGMQMERYRLEAEAASIRFKGGMSQHEVKALVRTVMRHMLFLHTEKPGVPGEAGAREPAFNFRF